MIMNKSLEFQCDRGILEILSLKMSHLMIKSFTKEKMSEKQKAKSLKRIFSLPPVRDDDSHNIRFQPSTSSLRYQTVC